MTTVSPRNSRSADVTAYAPGGIGNIGPGLDVLGCALRGAGDTVTASWVDGTGVSIVNSGHDDISADVERNSCGIAAVAVLELSGSAELTRERCIALSVTKGLPLEAGQGGSSASAVAAALAVNELLLRSGADGLDDIALMKAALVAETAVAGKHLDNIAAAMLGGVVCVRSADPPDVSRVPVKMDLWFALAHPDIRIRTADARSALPQFYPRDMLVAQLASVASLVNAFATGDLELLGRAMVDHVAELPRSALVPGFREAKTAALEAGALGASFSGAGPTTFAMCASEATAIAAAEAMRWAFNASGRHCNSRVATIDFAGAVIHA